MATFTPTASSTVVAGFSLWALVWTMVGHIDQVLKLFGIQNKSVARRSRLWVNENKVLTLCGTEIVNLSHAGLSPLGTTFAIGGTIFNLFYVFVINPLVCLKYRKRGLSLVKTAVGGVA